VSDVVSRRIIGSVPRPSHSRLIETGCCEKWSLLVVAWVIVGIEIGVEVGIGVGIEVETGIGSGIRVVCPIFVSLHLLVLRT
jgi:hypothetical protein